MWKEILWLGSTYLMSYLNNVLGIQSGNNKKHLHKMMHVFCYHYHVILNYERTFPDCLTFN